VAVSRVLSRSGAWVVLHGAALVSGGARRVAVIVEPAHPARIAPLLMSVYGLTVREQEVTRLVLQGNSTAEIAERLVVSAHTVQ
jgi:DNA-binding NarL/FixJ family response regulator